MMCIRRAVLLALFGLAAAALALGQGQNFTLWELSFNPVGPEYSDGRLNPFHVPAVREAMNWLINRQYIVENLCPPRWQSGMVLPCVTVLPGKSGLDGVA